MRWTRLRASGVGLMLGLIVGVSAVASAHTESTYYPTKWSADQTFGYGYLMAPLDTATARTSIAAGAGQWNAAAGNWFDITSNGVVNPMVIWIANYCSMTAGNWVVTRDVSPLGAVGNASLCGGANLTKVVIQFDDNANWYTGSGGPLASQYDLRSVAAHEFGHATGFMPSFNMGHFQTTDAACTVVDPNKNTMCAGASPGTVWKRDLASHDIHTVEAAY